MELAAGDERTSYLEGGRVPPGAVEQLFRAAEAIYHGAPWTHAHDKQVVRAGLEERSRIPPRLRNTDGDELVFVTDRFSIRPA